jgi:hypothetical protein
MRLTVARDPRGGRPAPLGQRRSVVVLVVRRSRAGNDAVEAVASGLSSRVPRIKASCQPARLRGRLRRRHRDGRERGLLPGRHGADGIRTAVWTCRVGCAEVPGRAGAACAAAGCGRQPSSARRGDAAHTGRRREDGRQGAPTRGAGSRRLPGKKNILRTARGSVRTPRSLLSFFRSS